MTLLDSSEPMLIPEGSYIFEIAAEPEKKTNEWGKLCWQFSFIVDNSSDTPYKFSDLIDQSEERYAELLIALGGQEDECRVVSLPDMTFKGMKFAGEVQHVRRFPNHYFIDEMVKPIPMNEKATADIEKGSS